MRSGSGDIISSSTNDHFFKWLMVIILPADQKMIGRQYYLCQKDFAMLK